MTRRSGGGGARAREATRRDERRAVVWARGGGSADERKRVAPSPCWPQASLLRLLSGAPRPSARHSPPPSPLLVPAHTLPRPATITSPFLRKWRRGEDRTDGWVPHAIGSNEQGQKGYFVLQLTSLHALNRIGSDRIFNF